MKREIVFGLMFVLFFGTSFVIANSMEREGNGPYIVELQLEKGWNIIAGTIPESGILEESEIKVADIEAMWYYSPLQKKYFQVHPNLDAAALQEDDDDFVLTNAMWIYSKKTGKIKYSTLEDYSSEGRQLYAGWNFVSMTPDMIEGQSNPDLTFDEIKRSCNVERAYHWNNLIYSGHNKPSWETIYDESEMDSTLLGKGILIKVSNDCKLGTSESLTSPPGLPTGMPKIEGTSCTDSDGGQNYLTKGETEGIYQDSLTDEERDERAMDSCLGDPGVNQEDINYYLERGIITASQSKMNNVLIEHYCVDKYIGLNNYECPNGCLNGACIQ